MGSWSLSQGSWGMFLILDSLQNLVPYGCWTYGPFPFSSVGDFPSSWRPVYIPCHHAISFFKRASVQQVSLYFRSLSLSLVLSLASLSRSLSLASPSVSSILPPGRKVPLLNYIIQLNLSILRALIGNSSGWVLLLKSNTSTGHMDGWEDIIGPFCFSWVVLGFPIQWWVVGWGRAERANPAIIRSGTGPFACSANQVTSIALTLKVPYCLVHISSAQSHVYESLLHPRAKRIKEMALRSLAVSKKVKIWPDISFPVGQCHSAEPSPLMKICNLHCPGQ